MKPSCGCSKNKQIPKAATTIQKVTPVSDPVSTAESVPITRGQTRNQIPTNRFVKTPRVNPTVTPKQPVPRVNPSVTPKQPVPRVTPTVVSKQPVPRVNPTVTSKQPNVTQKQPVPIVTPTVAPHVNPTVTPKQPVPRVTPTIVQKQPTVTPKQSVTVPKDLEYSKYTNKQLRSWNVIHMKAKEAVTPELKQRFIEYIQYLGRNFPCGKCSPHIRKYLKENPIKVGDKYIEEFENGVEISVSRWTHAFHNDVNKRLHRRIMPWDTYKLTYGL